MTDHFPTFKAFGRAGCQGVAAVARWSVAARTWRTLAKTLGALAAVAALGLISSHLSAGAADAKTRQQLVGRMSHNPAAVRWLTNTETRLVPESSSSFEAFEVKRGPVERLFQPHVRIEATIELDDTKAPVTKVAHVRTVADIPFICRSHYSAMYSWRREFMGRPSSAGTRVEGTVTYLAAFGGAIRIHDWATGFMFH